MIKKVEMYFDPILRMKYLGGKRKKYELGKLGLVCLIPIPPSVKLND